MEAGGDPEYSIEADTVDLTMLPVEDKPVSDISDDPMTGAPSDRWSIVRRTLVVLGWIVVAVLALFALLRIVAWDSLEPLIVVNAITLIVYLPAWIVALAAALGRRWLLMGTALLVVAAQIAFVAPEFLAASPLPHWVRGAPIVRLFDANIDKSLVIAPGYVRAIQSFHPDVITFEEFTPQALESLAASGILQAFPYRCAAPAPGATGFLGNCQYQAVVTPNLYAPYMVAATLTTPAGPVSLRLVHTLAPFPFASREWREALAAVDSSIRSSGTGRMLMTGDFNATWGNRGFVTLLGDGLTDGAAARGQALDMTWPNGAVVPPFVAIDHVLTGASLAVVNIATGTGFGSDHHYLTAEVAVRK
jgi:endonuclease/exonuclease/phosphatase (EEP) superfamily protein YafD